MINPWASTFTSYSPGSRFNRIDAATPRGDHGYAAGRLVRHRNGGVRDHVVIQSVTVPVIDPVAFCAKPALAQTSSNKILTEIVTGGNA